MPSFKSTASSLALVAVAQARTITLQQPISARDDASELITSTSEITTLDATNGSPAVIILDYDWNVEGVPAFEVVSQEGDTSTFEITYAESSAALNTYMVSSGSMIYIFIIKDRF